MKKQKNYDKKVKQTRIFLADYLLLKSLAQKAGVSMSEALHRLIIGLKPKAEPESTEPIAEPVTELMPAFRVPIVATIVSPPVAKGYRLQSTIVTNGNKAVAFRIKPKGARYD